jgi:phospholipase/carboxylesterase
MDLPELQIGSVTCLIAAAPTEPTAVMIMIHGYAMDAEHLGPLARAMGLPATLYFPRGLHPSPDGGRCWWLVDQAQRLEAIARGPRDLCDEYPAGRAEARAALLAIARYAQRQHPGLPLILAGFSQGGMLACDTLLHEELAVQGLILLSSSRIAVDDWRPRLPRLRGLPVLAAHGAADQDLSFAAGEQLRDELLRGGAEVTWLAFEGGHEIPFTVWRSIKRHVLKITQHRREA